MVSTRRAEQLASAPARPSFVIPIRRRTERDLATAIHALIPEKKTRTAGEKSLAGLRWLGGPWNSCGKTCSRYFAAVPAGALFRSWHRESSEATTQRGETRRLKAVECLTRSNSLFGDWLCDRCQDQPLPTGAFLVAQTARPRSQTRVEAIGAALAQVTAGDAAYWFVSCGYSLICRASKPANGASIAGLFA